MAEDDDRHVTPRFYHGAVLDQGATDAAGRRIYRDVEMVEVKYPGDPSRSNVAPAHDQCFMFRPRPGDDNGGKGFLTWAERFPEAYRRFKSNDPSAERTGTPLEHAPFLTPARVFELRALNIHTVEALARLPDGAVTQNRLRPIVEQAKTWLGETEAAAAVARAENEKAELQAQFDALRAEIAALKAGTPADDMESWDSERLRAYLVERGLTSLRANASRDTLLQAARQMMEAA